MARQRMAGSSRGDIDYIYIGPGGKRYRSQKEVRRCRSLSNRILPQAVIHAPTLGSLAEQRLSNEPHCTRCPCQPCRSPMASQGRLPHNPQPNAHCRPFPPCWGTTPQPPRGLQRTAPPGLAPKPLTRQGLGVRQEALGQGQQGAATRCQEARPQRPSAGQRHHGQRTRTHPRCPSGRGGTLRARMVYLQSS